MPQFSSESVISAGTDVYHFSHSLPDLLVADSFDSSKSNHEGAFFFTPQRTLRTNVIATAQQDLRVFDFTNIPQEELNAFNDAGDGNAWEGAATLGFDGRLFLTPDPFAEVAPGKWCHELVVLRDSIHKISDLRRVTV